MTVVSILYLSLGKRENICYLLWKSRVDAKAEVFYYILWLWLWKSCLLGNSHLNFTCLLPAECQRCRSTQDLFLCCILRICQRLGLHRAYCAQICRNQTYILLFNERFIASNESSLSSYGPLQWSRWLDEKIELENKLESKKRMIEMAWAEKEHFTRCCFCTFLWIVLCPWCVSDSACELKNKMIVWRRENWEWGSAMAWTSWRKWVKTAGLRNDWSRRDAANEEWA